MDFKFQYHQISDAERLWLSEAAKTPNFDPLVTKVNLLGRLPEDFDPQKLDRLLWLNDRPTLVGLWYVDPGNKLFTEIDLVIRTIGTKIRENPGIKEITADGIAEISGLNPNRVGQILYILGNLGLQVHDGASGPGNAEVFTIFYFKTVNIYGKYLHYKGIEDLLERYYLMCRPNSAHVTKIAPPEENDYDNEDSTDTDIDRPTADASAVKPDSGWFAITMASVVTILVPLAQATIPEIPWWVAGLAYLVCIGSLEWSIFVHAAPHRSLMFRLACCGLVLVAIGSLGWIGTTNQYRKQQVLKQNTSAQLSAQDSLNPPILPAETKNATQTVTFQNQEPYGTSSIFGPRLEGTLEYTKTDEKGMYVLGVRLHLTPGLGSQYRLELRVAGQSITAFGASNYVSPIDLISTKDGDDYCVTVDPTFGDDLHLEITSSQPEAFNVRYKLDQSTKGFASLAPRPFSAQSNPLGTAGLTISGINPPIISQPLNLLGLDHEQTAQNPQSLRSSISETPLGKQAADPIIYNDANPPIPPLVEPTAFKKLLRPLASEESGLSFSQVPNGTFGLAMLAYLGGDPILVNAREKGSSEYQYTEIFKDRNGEGFFSLWVSTDDSLRYNDFIGDRQLGVFQLVAYSTRWTGATTMVNIPLRLLKKRDLTWLDSDSNTRLILSLEKTASNPKR